MCSPLNQYFVPLSNRSFFELGGTLPEHTMRITIEVSETLKFCSNLIGELKREHYYLLPYFSTIRIHNQLACFLSEDSYNNWLLHLFL